MTPRRAPALALALATGLLTACADLAELGPRTPAFEATALGARLSPVDWPRGAWWTAYGDPVLDAWIERALAGNPNLKLAEARFAKARAAAGVAESALWPKLDGDADTTHRRFSENAEFPPPIGGSTQDLNHARLNASWEIDFFGRNRAAFAAALGSSRAAEAEAQAARILLASDVARSYFRLAALVEQRAIARATLAQREAIRDLVVSRVRAGLDTKVEQRQAEGTVPEIRRELEALDEQIGLARHALAALAGAGPDAAADLDPALGERRPQALPPALPADLVGRRGDLVAARWRVEAALRNVDVAQAAFYPNINLIALAGFSSFDLGKWFVSGSRETGLGAAIHLPIFDAGRLRANLRGASADAEAAVDSYNAALLQALREVADQITVQRAVERQSREQDAALAAAESAYAFATQRYRAGLTPYLVVLNTQTNVLTQRRIAVDLRARGIDANLQLIRALGGGYAGPLPPGA